MIKYIHIYAHTLFTYIYTHRENSTECGFYKEKVGGFCLNFVFLKEFPQAETEILSLSAAKLSQTSLLCSIPGYNKPFSTAAQLWKITWGQWLLKKEVGNVLTHFRFTHNQQKTCVTCHSATHPFLPSPVSTGQGLRQSRLQHFMVQLQRGLFLP